MYSILFEKSAQKNLYSLPKIDREKIFLSIQALSENPRPNGYKSLQAEKVIESGLGITGSFILFGIMF